MNEFDKCLLCGSENLADLKGYEENHLVQCIKCGFVFCSAKPSADELNQHYAQYKRDNSISALTLKRYEKLLDTFEKYRKTNNLLDVGCGDGYFLETAKKKKWNVYGTEFTPEAIEICERKGINMHLGSLAPEKYSKDFFDVITSFEVIEHINTPLHEIDSFTGLIRPGGVVYVTTPNFNSISRKISGKRWSIIEYPEHLCYYTQKTLKSLFDSKKYNLVDIRTTGISLNRLKSAYQPTQPRENTDEVLREKIEQHRGLNILKQFVNSLLTMTGKGDGIKACFEKR